MSRLPRMSTCDGEGGREGWPGGGESKRTIGIRQIGDMIMTDRAGQASVGARNLAVHILTILPFPSPHGPRSFSSVPCPNYFSAPLPLYALGPIVKRGPFSIRPPLIYSSTCPIHQPRSASASSSSPRPVRPLPTFHPSIGPSASIGSR